MAKKSFLIPGPCGSLEAVLDGEWGETMAVICHPHTLFGGALDNKVVTTLSRTLVPRYCSGALRFNFRGAGNSTGAYADGIGEQDDVRAVCQYAAEQGVRELWLAGFSFGGFVALSSAAGALALPLAGLILVAPAVTHFDASAHQQFPCPVWLAQSRDDNVVACEGVLAWSAGVQPAPQQLLFDNAGHFFHGGLMALRYALQNALPPRVSQSELPCPSFPDSLMQ